MATGVALRNVWGIARLTAVVEAIKPTAALKMDKLNMYYDNLKASMDEVLAAPASTNTSNSTEEMPGWAIPTGPISVLTPIVSLVLFILGVCLCIKTVRCCRKRVWGSIPTKDQQPLLVLKVYRGWQVSTCPLMALPYEANILTVSTAPRLLRAQLGCCACNWHLTFDGPLELTVGGTVLPVAIPQEAAIPMMDRIMAWRASRGPRRLVTSLSIIGGGSNIQIPYPVIGDMINLPIEGEQPDELSLIHI